VKRNIILYRQRRCLLTKGEGGETQERRESKIPGAIEKDGAKRRERENQEWKKETRRHRKTVIIQRVPSEVEVHII